MKHRAPKTILYVEDKPANIYLVQAILAGRADLVLLTATHGHLGLSIAQQQRPDLILLDLNLPDMDGRILTHLAAAEPIARTPVVILSADAMDEQRAHYSKLGIADYITKPFDIASFEKIVDYWLSVPKADLP